MAVRAIDISYTDRDSEIAIDVSAIPANVVNDVRVEWDNSGNQSQVVSALRRAAEFLEGTGRF